MAESEVKHIMVRASHGLHGKLARIAEIEHRSLNAQLLLVLEEYVRRYEQAHGVIDASPDSP